MADLTLTNDGMSIICIIPSRKLLYDKTIKRYSKQITSKEKLTLKHYTIKETRSYNKNCRSSKSIPGNKV